VALVATVFTLHRANAAPAVKPEELQRRDAWLRQRVAPLLVFICIVQLTGSIIDNGGYGAMTLSCL